MALAVSQKLVLHFLGGHVVVTPLHFVVNGIQGRTYVVQKGVYSPGIPAFGFARSRVPVVGLDALFRTELAKFAVYGDACHNHNLAVFLFRWESGQIAMDFLQIVNYATVLEINVYEMFAYLASNEQDLPRPIAEVHVEVYTKEAYNSLMQYLANSGMDITIKSTKLKRWK